MVVFKKYVLIGFLVLGILFLLFIVFRNYVIVVNTLQHRIDSVTRVNSRLSVELDSVILTKEKSDELKTIIRYKIEEIRKDSIIYQSLPQSEREFYFSKFTSPESNQ